MTTQKFFAQPMDVEAAFYQALERGDIDAMMSVWAEDEEVVCVLLGGSRLVGHALIREAWQHIFKHGGRFMVRVLEQTLVSTPFATVSSVLEQISSVEDSNLRAPIAATNVIVRGPQGWRLVAHHASAVPPNAFMDIPNTLH
ncbi:MAG TPA: nuclear transport factor 2 family protein [Rhodocyclaceae bacterium]|nr:nuclear transport factor 2 family protein [Rhodocyclaceae bacterium]